MIGVLLLVHVAAEPTNLQKSLILEHKLRPVYKQQKHTTYKNFLKNVQDTSEIVEFTSWSDWSVCDRYCFQNRVKKCRVRKKCGNTIMKEERNCTHEGIGGRATCKQHQQRLARRKARRFRIVQIPEEAKPRHGRGKNKEDWFTGHYGKWSKWSPCTRSCTTQRHRWCRIPGLCWKDVIRQSAYCYIEGSYCQRWIRRKIRDNYEDFSNDLMVDKYDVNINGIDNSTSVDEDVWKCGISKKNSRLSYFTRIIGGRPTAPASWPWQVAVLNRYGEAFCGGTLVSPRWVLTAAHCVRKRLSVRIGEYNLLIKEGTEIELRVDYAVTHPKYNAHTVDNDIALLRLPITLTPSDSRGIACLPTPWQDLPNDQLCTIIGWGKANASHEFGTDVLHEARIPIVSDKICRNVYVDYKITGNMFCAGYRRGRMDSCAGDSGGPLLCRNPEKTDHPWTIFGITSFGEGCGKRGKYGIYARLSNYVHWITKVIKQTDAYAI
ncbi:PREDICTED: coagulation factor IX [Ceratosolen solmsi marchali]|uniref:Coagulation factor IX n=1 Tax=Ceratosolen solmsi marchali TaxID=326594 RepID=A0AAJ7DXN4_9HYME|nr:PREDICTED: coagulation factor IX [Ceratosolen solmsi marchali]